MRGATKFLSMTVTHYVWIEERVVGTQIGNLQLRVCFDVELCLSPRWVEGNIGSTDAMKTCHNLNAYNFETNNHKVINYTSLDSFKFRY
jgi:hypothetical protein